MARAPRTSAMLPTPPASWTHGHMGNPLLLGLAIAIGCARSTRQAPGDMQASALAPNRLAPEGPNPSSVALDARVDAALAKAALQRAFSGVLLVASRDRILSRVSGSADPDRRRQITERSRFVIGSLSKSITASLVMREVEAGRMRLDAPIARYGQLGMAWAEIVQVQHLLNHTSGIQALDEPLSREPGTQFEYSNIGYDLLGRLVENTSGRTFTQAVRGLMENCGIIGAGTLDSTNAASLAVGFGESAEGTLTALPAPSEVDEHQPSGGLVASAPELMNWTRCLQSGRAVTPSSYARMIASASMRRHRWGTLGYGFGIQVSEADGLFELSHSGYVPGFVSTMLIYPNRCATVVVLENVATSPSDMARAFAPHDAVRNAVRQALREWSSSDVGCKPVASPEP